MGIGSTSKDSDLPPFSVQERKPMSWAWHLKSFALWGLAFFGIYASSTV
jgi:hypothetical protein